MKQFYPNSDSVSFKNQVEILKKLDNPYVIKYFHHFTGIKVKKHVKFHYFFIIFHSIFKEITNFGEIHSLVTQYYQVYINI